MKVLWLGRTVFTILSLGSLALSLGDHPQAGLGGLAGVVSLTAFGLFEWTTARPATVLDEQQRRQPLRGRTN